MNCLNNVTYGCTVVTHGASQRRRKSRTSQSCPRFAAAIRSFARCSREDGSRLLRLPPASISVSSTSRAIETGCTNSGQEDRVHREAFRSIGRTPAFICQQQKHIAERHCEPRSGGFSPAKEEAWVNGHQVGATRFSWNIGLIVCCRQNWNRIMDYWCLTSDGRSTRQRFRRN
jgi:hypothetical protein